MQKLRFASSVIALTLGAAPAALAATQIDYWMWDANQVAAYQACADAFQAEQPDIEVKISQTSWNDYWGNLTTSMVAGTAPDVFVDHVGRFPELLANQQVMDLTPLIQRDGLDLGIYRAGLTTLWQRDGKQYGLPKDWDTIALVYNKEMLETAGVDPAELENLTWNPKDGGTFEDVVAKLTLDGSGNNATSPDFDPSGVVQYGLLNIMGPDTDGYGQIEWSHFAASNGFRFIDAPWADQFHYDDPKLAETLAWIRGLGEKRLTVPFRESGRLGGSALFAAGQGALALEGAWMINWYTQNAPFEFGFAPLPAGPEGRKSMFNGLSDAIWSGTDQTDAAWAWVKYLGSPACQNIVGSHAVVFPAIPAATDIAQKTLAEQGLDVSPYVELAKPETTFLYPMTDRASEVGNIMKATIQEVLGGEGDIAASLAAANEKVNALLK